MRIIGARPGLIGDCVMATTIPPYLKRRFGKDTYVNWVVAAKCSQAAPLWLMHPSIDRLLISQGDAYQGLEDEVVRCGGAGFNPLPQHPEGDIWPNRRNIYEETWAMAGLPLAEYYALPKDQQYPHLSQWFKTERRAKSVAIWPGARQGEKEDRRNPGFTWWDQLATRLSGEGYMVWQCGHPKDMGGQLIDVAHDARHRSFMDLIALSLGCDVAIGTDSGSMIALAAYHSTPTISLLSPHWPGHVENPLAFGPLGARHTNLWAPTNNDHDIDIVIDKVKQIA